MKYWGIYIWDLILCVMISTGLSFNVFAGYEMNDPWSGNLFVVAGVVIAVMVILFPAYFNHKTILISVLITTTALIAAIAALQYTGAISGQKIIDENPLLFWIIVIVTSIAVFWMTRSRAGTVILFLAGTYMIAAFDLLRYPVSILGYIVFLFGTFVLFLYRVYCISLKHSETGKIDFRAYFIQSLLVSMVVFLLAGAVYYGAVKPLSPPIDEMKLVQKLMSMQILEKVGVSTRMIVYSDQLDNSMKNQQNEDKKENQKQKNKDKSDKDQNYGKLGKSSNLIAAMAIAYKRIHNMLWMIPAAIVLLLILAIFIKRLLRKKWYKNLQEKTNEDYTMDLYLYFVKKMRKAGFKRPDHLTLLEYASASQEIFDRFFDI